MVKTFLMEKKRAIINLLIYSDSPILGGHESMSVCLANEIKNKVGDNVKVTAAFYNQKCFDFMSDRVQKAQSPVQTPLPLPFIRSFNPINILKVLKFLKQIKPDILILSQGDIEFGLQALYAAKLYGCLTISYIPMTYSFKFTGARFGRLRDLINKFNYKLPDSYITINNFQKQSIKKYTSKSVYVLPNVTEMVENGSKNIKRTENSSVSLGIVGRVKLRQKNQMYAVRLFTEIRKWDRNAKIHFIGDGPDLPYLKLATKEIGYPENFVFHGWVEKDRLEKIIKYDIDVLLIPSRYEGVPLILLEALSFEKKFLITDFPWLDEYFVPSLFRIDLLDISATSRKLKRIWENDFTKEIRIIKNRVMMMHSIGIFKHNIGGLVNNLIYRSER